MAGSLEVGQEPQTGADLKGKDSSAVVPSFLEVGDTKEARNEHLKSLMLKTARGNIDAVYVTELEMKRARPGYRSPGELAIMDKLCNSIREESAESPDAKRVLAPHMEFCSLQQDELPGRGVVAIRYGSRPEQCQIAYDVTQAGLISKAMLRNRKDLIVIWQQYMALHEGAHCTPENSRGVLLRPVDVARQSEDEQKELMEYGELHAESLALFTLMRDSMRDGWFDPKVPELFSVARKYYKDYSYAMMPQYRHFDSWFDAYKSNARNLDREKIGNLTDAQISELAVSFANQKMDKISGKDRTKKDDFKAFSEITVERHL